MCFSLSLSCEGAQPDVCMLQQSSTGRAPHLLQILSRQHFKGYFEDMFLLQSMPSQAFFKSEQCAAGAVVGITCAILFLLFVFQRTGTSKVGFTFAPIVIVWYAANVMINLYNIAIYYPGKLLRMHRASWSN